MDMSPMENTERTDLTALVPPDFAVPVELRTTHAVLRPLGPEHNEADYAAWMSSIDHICATPGFGPPRSWPDAAMPLEQNLQDLIAHRKHFEDRVGFTYTVLDATDESRVLGCVYMYEDRDGDHDIDVRSWVVASRPELDEEVWTAVSKWLDEAWPFPSVIYAERESSPPNP